MLPLAAPPGAADEFPFTLSSARRLGRRPITAIAEAGSLVVLAQTDGRLTAVHATHGRMIWRRRPGGPVDTALLSQDGEAVWYADGWGQIGALGPNDGVPLSQHQRSRRRCARPTGRRNVTTGGLQGGNFSP